MGRQRTIEIECARPLDSFSMRKNELEAANGERDLNQSEDPILRDAGLPARMRDKRGWHGRRQTGWFRS